MRVRLKNLIFDQFLILSSNEKEANRSRSSGQNQPEANAVKLTREGTGSHQTILLAQSSIEQHKTTFELQTAICSSIQSKQRPCQSQQYASVRNVWCSEQRRAFIKTVPEREPSLLKSH